jgi:hypothetical protein
VLSSLLLTCLGSSAIGQGSLTSIKVNGENKSFEWFFLLADAGMQQGIWSKNGLDAQFVTYRQRNPLAASDLYANRTGAGKALPDRGQLAGSRRSPAAGRTRTLRRAQNRRALKLDAISSSTTTRAAAEVGKPPSSFP